jgi:hypothetical protein
METESLIGRVVAGAGGAALAISVFLTWYSLNFADFLRDAASQLPAQLSAQLPVQQLDSQLSGALASAGALTLRWSGWHGVHMIRFVLLFVGVAIVFNSLSRSIAPTNRTAWLVIAGGLLAVVLAVYRITSPPSTLDLYVGSFQVPSPAGMGSLLSPFLQVQIGPWVTLIGGGLVMLGGWAQLGKRAAPHPAVHPDLTATQAYPLDPASQPPPASASWNG